MTSMEFSRYSLAMTAQSYSQHLGMVGELQAARALLDIGASINSLTGSDFGWDLHVQLPERPPFLDGQSLQSRGSWPMSGDSVHVQVKYTSTGRRPILNVATARSWIRGNGVTFVMLLQPAGKITFMDEAALQTWVQATELRGRERRGLLASYFEPFSPERFSKVAHLWVAFPRFINNYRYLLDEMIAGGPVSDRVRSLLVEKFVVGFQHWFRKERSDDDDRELMVLVDRALDAFANGSGSLPDTDAARENLKFEIVQQIIPTAMTHGGYNGGEVGVACGDYAVGNREESVIHEMMDLIELLGRYARVH